ncbi:MAG: hypothetical protein ACK58L_03195 [Planctomycetota bacterium]
MKHKFHVSVTALRNDSGARCEFQRAATMGKVSREAFPVGLTNRGDRTPLRPAGDVRVVFNSRLSPRLQHAGSERNDTGMMPRKQPFRANLLFKLVSAGKGR